MVSKGFKFLPVDGPKFNVDVRKLKSVLSQHV